VTDLFSVKQSPIEYDWQVRRAVVHVNVDPAGALSIPQLERALTALRSAGFAPIATDLARHPPTRRMIELLREGDEPDELRRLAERACAAAVAEFEPPLGPRIDAVSFISTGTVEDAVGVVRAFGLYARPEDITLVDEDAAVVVLPAAALRRITAGKLQTALECALNRDVDLRESGEKP
jgi:hypothetical protein